MKSLILGGVTTVGFMSGAALGMRMSATDAGFTIVWSLAGAFAGMLLGEVLLHLIGSRQPRVPLRRSARHAHVQKARPFRSRLARFLHRNESEVMRPSDDRCSSMPFWSAVDSYAKTPPRSRGMLRAILLRIRDLLKRNPQGTVQK